MYFFDFKVFEREINNKYANLLEMEEIVLDIEALCNDKDAVDKMQSKIIEIKYKLNKLSPLSEQVNKTQVTFLIIMFY